MNTKEIEYTQFHYLSDLSDFNIDLNELKNRYDHLSEDELNAPKWAILKHSNGNIDYYHLSDFLKVDASYSTMYHGALYLNAFCYVGIVISDCGEEYFLGQINS
jgi:hypothetical protein